VIKNSGMLDVDEKRNLFACLWTSLSYNKVIKNKPLEFNDLNKLSHKINILEDSDGTISMRNYSLGIRFAALAKDVDFLIEFMNYYRNLLRPSVIENMTLYSNAYLNFANKKFDTALELASKINFDLTTFKYELKNLLIMIYYELDDADSVIYSSDSYRHFAANNKYVSEESRILIIKFINYVNTLCKLRISPDNIKLGMLKESVLNDSLNTKYWLLEKIEELEKL
nr:hypothetical protein [Ignavibacteria bacterium]